MNNRHEKILDVGCGKNKHEGAVGLDYNPLTGADIIHDLNEFPYPFEDNEFDMVTATHVVEHLPNVMDFVDEIYRITRNGGRIKFVTPHYTNPDWNTDPTHTNHFSSYSFNTFDSEKRNFDFYTSTNIKPTRRYVTVLNLWRVTGLQFLINIDHKFPSLRFIRKFWEQYLCYIFRGKDIYFEFKVVKNNE